ncbi:MAG: sugar phosphate nucleotidyltransferase [Pseudomonadota bacterium]
MKKNSEISGVILAAGRGMRAYPKTKYIPKALLEVDGTPLIERNIEIMRDQLGVKKIIVVVGHYGSQIPEYLNQKNMGVDFTFVLQKQQKGIGHALLMVEEHIREDRFVVMLADEFYLDSNHRDIFAMLDQNAGTDAVLLFKKVTNSSLITKNFTGNIQQGRVRSLIEKPENPTTDMLGVGTYLLNRKVFQYIRQTPPSELRQEVEITDVLSNMARQEVVMACLLEGKYLNVNNTDDLNQANYLIREEKFSRYKVSVVIPAYNEEKTIEGVVQDFSSHPVVSEVVVVDNNSMDRTSEIAEKAGARVVLEMEQGYGCALRRGLDEAAGDIIILTEADGTFRSKDVPKFMEYLKDCDMVVGTRTTRQMIEQGTNMKGLVRWVNVLFGKIIELLWWNQEPRFTDVGCTYRAIWKTSYQRIRPLLSARGPEFAPEMMIAVLICKQRIIEIPISYLQRLGGESKHSGEFSALARTALKMMKVILKYRFFAGIVSEIQARFHTGRFVGK